MKKSFYPKPTFAKKKKRKNSVTKIEFRGLFQGLEKSYKKGPLGL